MSQPCSAVELVLFDARALSSEAGRAALATVEELGVLRGALLDGPDVSRAVSDAHMSDQLDFWFGENGGWPFERALAFAGVEPGRTLFVSADGALRDRAEGLGLQVHAPDDGDIAARLP